jgi:hypothetical protein
MYMYAAFHSAYLEVEPIQLFKGTDQLARGGPSEFRIQSRTQQLCTVIPQRATLSLGGEGQRRVDAASVSFVPSPASISTYYY